MDSWRPPTGPEWAFLAWLVSLTRDMMRMHAPGLIVSLWASLGAALYVGPWAVVWVLGACLAFLIASASVYLRPSKGGPRDD